MEKNDLAQVFTRVNLLAAVQELLIGCGLVLLACFWTRPEGVPAVVESVST